MSFAIELRSAAWARNSTIALIALVAALLVFGPVFGVVLAPPHPGAGAPRTLSVLLPGSKPVSVVPAAPSHASSQLQVLGQELTPPRTHLTAADRALAAGRSSGANDAIAGLMEVARPIQVGPAPRANVPAQTTSGGAGWEGVNSNTSECSCAPPDVILAVGTTYVVEMNNLEERIFTKSGTFVSNQSLHRFFGAASVVSLADPRILYDNLTGRWFASIHDLTSNQVIVAASTTSAPTGSWYVYYFSTWKSEYSPDQPYIGVSTWAVGLSHNDFNISTGFLDGNGYQVLNKTEMMAGALTYYTTFNPFGFVPSIRAASSLTPDPIQRFGGINPSFPAVIWVNVTGVPPSATPTLAAGGAIIGPISIPPSAAQLGTVDKIATSDNRAISVVWQNQLETLTFTSGCSGLSCGRVEQVWDTNGTLRQDFSLFLSGGYVFYPAASVDSRGDITFTAGYSSAALYPSAAIAGEAWNEPGALGAGQIFPAIAGSAPVTVACNATSVCRYGDYFGAATDPSSSLVFTGSEYNHAMTFWSTWIAQAYTSPVSATPPVANPATFDLSQSTAISTSPAWGGTGGYTYTWSGLPPGCVAANAPSLPACTPSGTGTYPVTLVVNDTYPTTYTSHVTITVNAKPAVGPPTDNRPTADVGQVVTFTSAGPTGGTPGYTYAWAGLPASGCTGTTTVAATCTVPAAGTLLVRVTVTDSASLSATSANLTFVVSPALAITGPTASATSVNTGASLTLTVTVTGGSGGTQYSWSGLPKGCASSNAASITCTPNATGTYNVSVSVTDSNGGSATSGKLALTVTAPPSGGGFLGLPGVTGWILLAVIGAAVAILLVVLLTRKRRPPTPQPAPPSPTPAAPPPDWMEDTGPVPPPGAV